MPGIEGLPGALQWLMHGGYQHVADQNDPTFQSELASLRQYDPNASISQTQDDGGTFYGLNFDASKLPTVGGKQFNQFSSADSLVGPNRGIQSAPFSLKNPGAVQASDLYGLLTDPGNVNINEKVNRAQQHTLLDTIGPLLVGGVAGFAGMPSFLSMLMKQFSQPGGGPLASIMQLLQGQKTGGR